MKFEVPQRGRAATRRVRPHVVVTALAASICVVGLGLLASAGTAGAQVTPPTVPCEGCGGGPPADGTNVWSFPEFVCEPQRGFLIVFGVGRNVSEAVNFSAGIAPLGAGPVGVERVASGVQPGQQRTTLLPTPTATGTVRLRVVGVGANSGRVLLDNTRELDCNCDQPTTTTPTTVPEQVTTTTPGSPTSVARTTDPATSSSVPGTLPETGSSSSWPFVAGGLVLLTLGGAAMLAVATGRRAPDDEPA